MGIIDKITYEFECPKCKIKESARILDKGSSYDGSCWGEGPSLKNFNATWKGKGQEEPHLVSSNCKICLIEPNIKIY